MFNLHPILKYTKEDEKQSTISFLNMSVQRNDYGKYNTEHKKNQKSSLVLFSGLPFVIRKQN